MGVCAGVLLASPLAQRHKCDLHSGIKVDRLCFERNLFFLDYLDLGITYQVSPTDICTVNIYHLWLRLVGWACLANGEKPADIFSQRSLKSYFIEGGGLERKR